MKSIPIVVIKEGVQASSQNRSKRHDFPTPKQQQASNKHRSARTEVALSSLDPFEGKLFSPESPIRSSYRNMIRALAIVPRDISATYLDQVVVVRGRHI